MNNPVRGNKASMLRKSRIPISSGSYHDHVCDHISRMNSYRVSKSPPPLRATGSRIPISTRSRRVRTPNTSPERNARTTRSSLSKPAISEGKKDRRAGSPDAKQEPKTKRNNRTNRSPRSEPAIPEGKQNCKAEKIVSTKLGSQSKPAINYGKQDREDRKSEPEASAKRSYIKSSPAPASVPTDLETKLADEALQLNLTINKLKKKLLDCENLVSEQALRLAQSKASQRAKDEAMVHLKSELLAAKADYDHMVSRLEETNLGLERATSKANKQSEHSKFLECGLAEAKHTIASDLNKIRELQEKLQVANAEVEIHSKAEAQLREEVDRMHVKLEGYQQELVMHSNMIQTMKQDEQDLRGDLEKQDKLINQVSAELAVRDEEFKNLFETLKFKQTKLRNQEHNVKLLEQRNRRLRTKLEARNAALKKKIVLLKLNLRDYSQVIIGNNGKPFFEEISTPISQDTVCELSPIQEQLSHQHLRKPSRRHN